MDLNIWGLILSGILIVPGIYLVLMREQKSIRKGTRELQTMEAGKKGGTFKVSLGVTLILLSIVVFYLMVRGIPDRERESDSETTSKNIFFDGWIVDTEGNDVDGALITIQETNDTTRSGSDGHFRIQLNKDHKKVTVSIIANGYKPFTAIKESRGTAAFTINKN